MRSSRPARARARRTRAEAGSCYACAARVAGAGVAWARGPARDEPSMSEAARINLVEFTVSELAAALKRTVEDAYAYVRVRGEISGFRGRHASGHCYFALKDEGAKIEAVIWKSSLARMRIRAVEGVGVSATGRVSTYPTKSTYQIVIEVL